jgi:hypothetical protein
LQTYETEKKLPTIKEMAKGDFNVQKTTSRNESLPQVQNNSTGAVHLKGKNINKTPDSMTVPTSSTKKQPGRNSQVPKINGTMDIVSLRGKVPNRGRVNNSKVASKDKKPPIGRSDSARSSVTRRTNNNNNQTN